MIVAINHSVYLSVRFPVLFFGAKCDHASEKFTPRCQLDTSVNNVAGPCDRRTAVGCGEELRVGQQA